MAADRSIVVQVYGCTRTDTHRHAVTCTHSQQIDRYSHGCTHRCTAVRIHVDRHADTLPCACTDGCLHAWMRIDTRAQRWVPAHTQACTCACAHADGRTRTQAHACGPVSPCVQRATPAYTQPYWHRCRHPHTLTHIYRCGRTHAHLCMQA